MESNVIPNDEKLERVSSEVSIKHAIIVDCN